MVHRSRVSTPSATFTIRSLAATLLLSAAAWAQQASEQAPPAASQKATPLAIGDAAPPLGVEAWSQLPDGVDGYDWASLRGTTVVVEFWATWCGPCIAAIPHMNDLAEAFQGEVVFISVTDEPEEKTFALRDKRPMKSVLGFDTDKSMHKAYGVRAIPATFVVDKAGTIASITHPNVLTAQTLRGYIDGKRDEPVEAVARPRGAGMIASGLDPLDREETVPVGQLIFREAVGKGMFRAAKNPVNATSIDSSPLELITFVYEVQPWQVTMPEGYDDEAATHYDLIVRLPEETFGDQRTLVRDVVLRGMGMAATVTDTPVRGYKLQPAEGGLKMEQADPVEPGGYSTSGFTFSGQAADLHSFGWWLQGVLAAPLDRDPDLDLKARYPIDFGVHAAFDPAHADDVAMLRKKLEDELGLVLAPQENTVPMVTVVTRPKAGRPEPEQN
jgi:uncharacterized protein (TIGR03435 family)